MSQWTSEVLAALHDIGVDKDAHSLQDFVETLRQDYSLQELVQLDENLADLRAKIQQLKRVAQ